MVDGESFGTELATIVKDYFDRKIAKSDERMIALETAVAALAARVTGLEDAATVDEA